MTSSFAPPTVAYLRQACDLTRNGVDINLVERRASWQAWNGGHLGTKHAQRSIESARLNAYFIDVNVAYLAQQRIQEPCAHTGSDLTDCDVEVLEAYHAS